MPKILLILVGEVLSLFILSAADDKRFLTLCAIFIDINIISIMKCISTLCLLMKVLSIMIIINNQQEGRASLFVVLVLLFAIMLITIMLVTMNRKEGHPPFVVVGPLSTVEA